MGSDTYIWYRCRCLFGRRRVGYFSWAVRVVDCAAAAADRPIAVSEIETLQRAIREALEIMASSSLGRVSTSSDHWALPPPRIVAPDA